MCYSAVKDNPLNTCYLFKGDNLFTIIFSVMPSISSEVLRFKAGGLRSVVQAQYPRFKGFWFKD